MNIDWKKVTNATLKGLSIGLPVVVAIVDKHMAKENLRKEVAEALANQTKES